MENWIFPLTVLPGIGLLIMSTTNLVVALTAEINEFLSELECDRDILTQKIGQMRLLNSALVALYICAALFATGGFFGAVLESTMLVDFPLHTLTVGVGMLFLIGGTVVLIVYGFRAVRIKRKQFVRRLKR